MNDVFIAARGLRWAPRFSLFVMAIMLLATCVMATVAAFVAGLQPSYAYVNGSADRDKIVALYGPWESRGQISIPDLNTLRDYRSIFSEIVGWTRASIDWVPARDAELTFIEVVTGDYFQFLGVSVEHGRSLFPADDDPASSPVALMSHAVWRQRFGADPAVVGRSIRLGSRPVRVVGIMSPEYRGPGVGTVLPATLWLTYSGYDAVAKPVAGLPARAYALTRLRSGVSVRQAQGEVSQIASSCCIHLPRPYLSIEPEGFVELGYGATKAGTYLAAAAQSIVIIVVLIACVNVAGLLTGRTLARRGDILTRIALGASPWAAVRVPFFEGALLVLCGGAAGIGVAVGLAKTFTMAVLLPMGVRFEMQPRVNTLLIAGAVLFVLVVAVATAGGAVAGISRRESLGAGRLRPMWRWQRSFAVFQVALSSAVVVAAVSVADASRGAAQATESFDLDNLVVAAPNPQMAEEMSVRAIRDAVVRIDDRSTIHSTTVVSGIPGIAGPVPTRRVETVGSSPAVAANLMSIASSEAVINTLGLRMLTGRDFLPDETDVAILTDGAVNALFGQSTAVGQSVRVVVPGNHQATTLTVIGVVQEFGLHHRDRRPRGTIFLPWRLASSPPLLAARVREPETAIATIREAFRQAAPELALAYVRSGRDLQESETYINRLALRFTAVAGAFATLLAVAGLYALLACLGTLRKHELAIRAALGAPRQALTMVLLGDSAKSILPASFAGVCVGWLLTIFLSRMGVSVFGEIGFIAAMGVWLTLVAAAIIALRKPVRQATEAAPASLLNAQ